MSDQDTEKVVHTTMDTGTVILVCMFISCWIGLIAGLTQYVLMAVFE